MLVEKPLRELAYYQTGGKCQYLFAPSSIKELAEAIQFIRQNKLKYFLLGGGTNSLVMDDPWEGAVISFHRMNKIKQISSNTLLLEAGVSNTAIAEFALSCGLTGAGWMNLLPGQIGGTTRMNARCYGGEIGDIISSVTTVTAEGDITTFNLDHIPRKTLFMGYKNTKFMHSGELIAEVSLRLNQGDYTKERELMDHCANDRHSKHQFDFPTCGCVFKNDYSSEVSISSGFLLEKAGAKGLHLGGAWVSDGHANFVYNKGASSRDILELSVQMREKVWAEFGVWLEYEMEILGHIPQDLNQLVQEKRKPAYRREKLETLRQQFKRKLITS